MVKKEAKTGKELEQRVAEAYRAMGARKVEHDVELAILHGERLLEMHIGRKKENEGSLPPATKKLMSVRKRKYLSGAYEHTE